MLQYRCKYLVDPRIETSEDDKVKGGQMYWEFIEATFGLKGHPTLTTVAGYAFGIAMTVGTIFITFNH